MKLQQLLITKKNSHRIVSSSDAFEPSQAQLVLVFGQRTLLEKTLPYQGLQSSFPNAQIIICSSSGQISNNCNVESDIVATAISFDKSSNKSYRNRYSKQ
jgi:hypothetical protein